MNDVKLFSDRDITEVELERESAMFREIGMLDVASLTKEDIKRLCASYDERFSLRIARFVRDAQPAIEIDEAAQVDARYLPGLRHIDDPSRPCWIAGYRYRIYLPFEGEPDSFRWNPTRRFVTTGKPRAHLIEGNELVVDLSSDSRLDTLGDDIAKYRRQVEQWLGFLREGLRGNFGDTAAIEIEVRQSARSQLVQDVEAAGFQVRNPRRPESYVTKPSTTQPLPPISEVAPTLPMTDPTLKLPHVPEKE